MIGPQLVDTADELASLISDGERISVSGFHFVRAPMAMLRALLETPAAGLTYVAWGGGLPLELLLSRADKIRRVEFCFSSLDIFGLAPRFRHALESGAVEAIEMTALAYIKGLRASLERLPFELLQEPTGSDLHPGYTSSPDRGGGDGLATVPAITIDTMLLHASRADEEGNVEIDGALGHDVLQCMSARRVLATVEQIVPPGTLGRSGAAIIPRTSVHAFAEVPFGAYPTSCIPQYPADYRQLFELSQVTDRPLPNRLLEPTGDRRRCLTGVTRRTSAELTASLRLAGRVPTDRDYTVAELMTILVARAVEDGSFCSVGSVSPLATCAYLLAKAMWAPNATILTHNGGYLDVDVHPAALMAAELLDYKTATRCLSSDEAYTWFYQRGIIDHEIVSAAQVDQYGATNTVWIERDNRRVRLPGQGGMADVANMHRNFFIYLPRHSPRTLVEQVDFVGARRALGAQARRDRGYRDGAVVVLTNLGRFELDPAVDRLVLTHHHPGVELDTIREQTGFDVVVADQLQESVLPTPEELTMLRLTIDPLGIRDLEFVPAVERTDLLATILATEEQALTAPLC